jgi:RNA-directed DNA polymerase
LCIEDIAKRINPVIRGWLNYYGRYYRSALYPILLQIQNALVRWVMRKYKRLRGHWLKTTDWLGRIARREPDYFRSGDLAFGCRLDSRSRMTGNCHVPFLESVGVKLPSAN